MTGTSERQPNRVRWEHDVHRLRAALRGEPSAPSINRAAEPVVAKMYEPLLRHCDHLARSVSHRVSLQGEDIAQEAWRKMLDYLQRAPGDRVRDDLHFQRLLHCAAKTRLLDLLQSNERTGTVELDAGFGETQTGWEERLADTSPSPEDLILPRDSNYIRLVQLLFAQPDRFHKRFRQQNQRHPRQYQALVLYQMASLFHETIQQATPDPIQRDAIRQFAENLGGAARNWQQIEAAVNLEQQDLPQAGLLEGTLNTVNAVCKTQITQRKTLITYRAELHRFARQASSDTEDF